MDSQLYSRNAKNFVIDSTIKASFLATYHRQQTWPFPDTLIYYITKNPSNSKVYQKLIQTCKHFFIKNPVIVAESLMSNLVSSTSELLIKNNEKEIKVRNISTKIWITDKCMLSPSHPISCIIPKIYRFDTKELDLWQQLLFLNEFIFLASKCETIIFHNSTIINQNGTVVTMEKIFAVLENTKSFNYYFFNNDAIEVTSKTAKELIRIPRFSNLHKFAWGSIPEIFGIECFYDYIKKNEKTKFYLEFCETISDAYKARLQKIVNEILAVENRKFRVPYIYFSGIDETSFSNLEELRKMETQN